MTRTHICKHCSAVFDNITIMDFASHVKKCGTGKEITVIKTPRDEFLKLIESKHPGLLGKIKPMLWWDELKNVFILTRNIEIYMYSEKELGLYCWNYGYWNKIKGKVQNAWRTDPPYTIYTGRIVVEMLPELLKTGSFKTRPHLKGEWLEDKKRILGHEINQCNPDIFS